MNIFYSIYNFYNDVLELKTKYFLLTALAIYMCIGQTVQLVKYLAIVIMLYAASLAYKLNKVYGYLWLFLIAIFIYSNDILGFDKFDKDKLKEVDSNNIETDQPEKD